MDFIWQTSLFFTVLCGLVSAVPWSGPQATAHDADLSNANARLAWSPKPTKAPRLFGRMAIDGLFPRKEDQNNICGYYDGTETISCSGGYTCLGLRSESVIGCCEGSTDCGYFTSCVDATETCDDACSNDIHIRKCSDLAKSSWCHTWSYSSSSLDFNGFSQYHCGADPYSTFFHIRLKGGFKTLLEAPTTTTTTPSTTATSTSTPPPHPVGAIAGSVVGSVALLVVLVLGILHLRNRAKASHPPTQQSAPAFYVPPPPPPPVPTAPAVTAVPQSSTASWVQTAAPQYEYPQHQQGFAHHPTVGQSVGMLGGATASAK